jgi:hypothetical protein
MRAGVHFQHQHAIRYIVRIICRNASPLSLSCVGVRFSVEIHLIITCDVSRFNITEELADVSSIQRSVTSVELCERMMSRV